VISSWLLKVVLGIAFAGLLALELGSPLVAKAQADSAAHDVADEVAFRLPNLRTEPEFQQACKEEAEKRSVKLLKCTVDPSTRNVTATIQKEALSIVLKNVSVTKDWYFAKVTATAKPR
jgi:hypothetical protein